jgi:hypothetical protein
MKINFKITLILFLFIGIITSCNRTNQENKPPQEETINLQHFNHLYKEINIAGDTLAIVHIYSEFPDYDFVIEPSEGFTCVDDVARAIVMLSQYYKTGKDSEKTLRKLKMLTKFILFMQNKNGYFNNFIWNDYSINTTYKTTVAELNWWSLRAFWALETVLPLFSENPVFLDKIETSIDRLWVNIKTDLSGKELKIDTINGLKIPSWLPNKYAADQAAVLILGLLPYHKRTEDIAAKNMIDHMAKGIILMQKGGKLEYPYGAFMSWENLWHAWGNSQAFALLKAGQQFDNQEYIKSGLKEVDHFYPYLLKNGFAEAFWIEKNQDGFSETKRNEFPRIAYGIRPMVWAASEAYQITKKEVYLDLSEELKSWFFGNNVLKIDMYDATTGRGYDGIISNETFNHNSGAESTIECLMTFLETN